MKRLFKRYEEDDEPKVRLILNHPITLYNCFKSFSNTHVVYEPHEYSGYLKPFVIMLGYIPDKIEYNGLTINNSDISLDDRIVQGPRNI